MKNKGNEFKRLYRVEGVEEGQMTDKFAGLFLARSANYLDTPLSQPCGARGKASTL